MSRLPFGLTWSARDGIRRTSWLVAVVVVLLFVLPYCVFGVWSLVSPHTVPDL